MDAKKLMEFLPLIALPAPLVVIGIFMALFYAIMADVEVNLTEDEAAVVEADAEEEAGVSANAAALATLAAAPERTVASSTSAEGIEVASAGYTEELIATGESSYLTVCSACHGIDALGISGLGKTLIDSEFVRGLNDDDLVAFIIEGRTIWDEANTTGAAMPARGGNPGLTDEDTYAIVAYIRTIDGFVPAGGGAVAAAPMEEEAVVEEPAVEEAPAEVVDTGEFELLDISAALDSLGVDLPDPLPQPSRDGEAVFNDLCGIRYDGEDAGFTASALDICDYLLETASGDFDRNELSSNLRNGVPIWAENNVGVNILPGVSYPPLSDREIDELIGYIVELVAPEPEEPAALDGEALYTERCEGVPAAIDFCSAFVELLADGSYTVEELAGFLTTGLNTASSVNLGVNVPARGGFPELTDEEITTLIEYLQTLAEGE